MAYLDRNQIKEVVKDSLSVVADLPDDVESSTFENFNSNQKHAFLTALKSKLNALPYNMNDGTSNHSAYYDVDLTPDSTDDWPTVRVCIDWIANNQRVVYL